MSDCPPALDRARLEELLRGAGWIRRIELVDRVGSTNDVVRELAASGAPEGTVVLAEEQIRGRGRHGRAWHSPRGLGLYVSVLLRPRVAALELTRWTLGAAVAACESCRRLVDVEAAIRWPNDLLCRGAKVGGVLAESRAGGDPPHELVLGTGINVGQTAHDFPRELAGCATSLRLAGRGAPPERERLAAAYLQALGLVAHELEAGRWSAIRRRWEALAPGAFGQAVRVREGRDGPAYEGLTAGLDEVGALRVRRPDGRIACVRGVESVSPAAAGEV